MLKANLYKADGITCVISRTFSLRPNIIDILKFYLHYPGKTNKKGWTVVDMKNDLKVIYPWSE